MEGCLGPLAHGLSTGPMQLELARRNSTSRIVATYEFGTLNLVLYAASLMIDARREAVRRHGNWLDAIVVCGSAQHGKVTFAT